VSVCVHLWLILTAHENQPLVSPAEGRPPWRWVAAMS
jgi:hypothetical protein